MLMLINCYLYYLFQNYFQNSLRIELRTNVFDQKRKRTICRIFFLYKPERINFTQLPNENFPSSQDIDAKSQSVYSAFLHAKCKEFFWSKLTCLRLKNPFLSQLGRYKDRAITREVSFIPWMIPSSFLLHGPFWKIQHRVTIKQHSH